MRRSGLVAVLFVMILAASTQAVAQINPNEDQGLKPYGTWHGGDLDSISVTNGALSLHIPLASFPQRGNLDLSFMVRFSNKQWHVKPAKFDSLGHVITPAQWLPSAGTGVQLVSSTDWLMFASYAIEPQDPNIQGQTLYDWAQSVSSPEGGTHQFGDMIAAFSGPLYPMRSLDASGILHLDPQTVIMANGTRYSYPTLTASTNTSTLNGTRSGVQPSSIIDANGNQITISTSAWTDTMGRVIPGSANPAYKSGIQPGVPTTDLSKCPAGTSSALIWNVPGVATVNGGVRTFYFCYSMFTLQTTFDSTNNQGAQNYGPTSTSMLSAVVLPDLTMWTFTYDNWGDVLRVGFPTGGSLSYTYGVGPLSSSSGTGFSTWAMSRTVDANDGTGGHQWAYNYQGNFPTGVGTSIYPYSVKGVATITSPDNNDVVHNIGPGVNGSGCPGFVYQTQVWQGRSGSGTVLKTLQSQYDCTLGTPGGNLDGIALNTVPTQVTTVWPGGQTSKVVSAFDSTFTDPNGQAVRIGSVLQKDEYDYSNTLARSTLNRYLWQDNATYKSSNFVNLVEWTTVYNGSAPQSATLPACSSSSTPACISQTKYAYDEGTRVASGIGLPTHVAAPAGDGFRGNLTTLSRWLDTSSSFVSGTNTILDTGMKASSTDPLGHVTAYTYSSTFLGAYLTQTNLPDTQMPDSGAPVIHHVVSANYDFNTSLITSFMDENGQVFNYSYDVMLRLTEGDHPDGGVTKFLYPDPNTVERQRLITGTSYDDFKMKLDGVARPYQAQRLTPDCATYVKVDTVYDSVGRATSESNPYCLTTEATYGVRQTQFDALSRVTKTTKQDQSFSTAVFNDTPGDLSGPPMVCTTSTDEAGKKRQTCTDAFGRLVKVVEPNPGAAATNATGSVTVSGTEQSATSQSATPASVTVTIGGADSTNVSTVCTTTCRTFNIKDSGTIQFTVVAAGVTVGPVSASYNGSSTPATLAAALFSAFPANSVVTMSNPNGGTSFTLTTTATGSAANSSTISTLMASSCVDSDTLACAGVGWTMTLSGPNLAPTTASSANFTGGQNAVAGGTDSGTITVTVNGTGYATTFGASDTPSTIAGRLASLIAAGSWANATASAGTINLASKIPGIVGDYSLSASYTWNSALFSNPSFTTSTSGSSLAGAKDASAINNNPFVTTYQYNARGDLLCVHQKAADTTPDVACTGTTPPAVPAAWRQRFFTYDSLSRLLTAMNPETNSTGNTKITYAYDNDSRAISKTEPAPNQPWGSSLTVTVNYTYDALDRLLDTTYVGSSTQSSSHRYDYASFLGQTFTFPIGREVAATAAGNTIEYFMNYDPMGRIKSTTQCNPGVTGCKTFTATYDKLGDLTSLVYPANNFTVTYGYDSAARLISATDSNGVIYAQNPVFWASGVMKEFTSPNFNNNKFHVELNNRLQPTEIWAGPAQGATALFDKQFQYNPAGQTQFNNGNVYTITNVKDSTRSQNFTYDPLNRLLTAGDGGHWANSYVYDAWGNLLQKNPGSPAGENLVKTADANNHLSGFTYDAGGNEIADGLGGTFVFDAENRIASTAGVTYTYDAFGRRVNKSTGINYWYGPNGSALAETDSAGNWTNYIFFGAQRLARNVSGDIKYYITDHLRSTAMFVDKAGTSAAVLDDNDFYPWGGVVPGVGKTTSNNTIKFTGQYRDTESQLDYFGARYYGNVNGRFMSPDWAAKPVTVPYGKFEAPSCLNLYAYVCNNPTTLVDPDGHEEEEQKQDVKPEVNGPPVVVDNHDGTWTVTQIVQTSDDGKQTTLDNGQTGTQVTTTTTTYVATFGQDNRIVDGTASKQSDVTTQNYDGDKKSGDPKTVHGPKQNLSNNDIRNGVSDRDAKAFMSMQKGASHWYNASLGDLAKSAKDLVGGVPGKALGIAEKLGNIQVRDLIRSFQDQNMQNPPGTDGGPTNPFR